MCLCREVSRDREKKRDQEDEEEAYERRKLERKLRDKEAAYQEVGNLGTILSGHSVYSLLYMGMRLTCSVGPCSGLQNSKNGIIK